VLGAAWQRCRVHFTRNLQACAPRDCQGMVAALLRQVFTQPDPESAKAHWRQVADPLRGKFPKAAALMDEAEDDALAHLGFPAAHRVKLHSTNPPGAGPGGQAAHRRGRHLPQRGQHQAAGRGGADGAERRLDAGKPLHGAGDHGRNRRRATTAATGLARMTTNNLTGKRRTGIYTILTDATRQTTLRGPPSAGFANHSTV